GNTREYFLNLALLNYTKAKDIDPENSETYFHLASLYRHMGEKEKAAEMESDSVRDYNIWANECSKNADSVSKKIFEALVEDEERHYDQYDTEIDNLTKFGDNYLALQSIERSKNIASGKPTE
ncbi:MAG TPA: hypothetical protein PLU45_01610, partial [Bacteroidales bacterium]|nr:hypothetical protein [Bacteroidales bacterium]